MRAFVLTSERGERGRTVFEVNSNRAGRPPQRAALNGSASDHVKFQYSLVSGVLNGRRILRGLVCGLLRSLLATMKKACNKWGLP